MLKILFGELAVILLKGSRISAKKVTETNFKFQFPTLKKALGNFN